MQKRIAELAANSSTLRRRPKGTVKKTQCFLRVIKLEQFSVEEENDFKSKLNVCTNRLRKKFPSKAKNDWGAARKVLNIFLRDVLYNRILCRHYKFRKIEEWMEVPLDKYVYDGLKEDAGKMDFRTPPTWSYINKLKLKGSNDYQEIAKDIAGKKRILRVDLDLVYWRNKEDKKLK
jgi:hypothetical protein